MKILSAILIIIAAAIVITLIKALFYKADVPTPESFPEAVSYTHLTLPTKA